MKKLYDYIKHPVQYLLIAVDKAGSFKFANSSTKKLSRN